MFAETATHLPQHKKYQLHIFFHGFCTKIYSEAAAQIFTVSAQNVLKIFHNIFDGQCNSLDARYQNNDKKNLLKMIAWDINPCPKAI